MKLTVFGTGCPKCQMTEQHARQAIEELGLSAEIDHVRDPLEMARRNVLFTPALAIDDEVRCAGKVPSVEEIKAWLQA